MGGASATDSAQEIQFGLRDKSSSKTVKYDICRAFAPVMGTTSGRFLLWGLKVGYGGLEQLALGEPSA